MTLNRKIIIITASILFVSLLTGSIVNIIYFKKNYTEALITGSYGLGSSLNSVVSELLNLGLPLDSLSGLNKKCEQIVKQNPHIRYAGITNLEGKTLYHSDQSIIGRVFTDEVAMRSVKTTKPLTQIYRRFDGNVYYDLTLPIFDSQNTHVGVIRLGFPKEFIDEKVTKAILQVILNFSISFVVIIILLNYFMSKFITNRLVELLNQTKKIMDGNYEETIPVSQNDEIGYLTESFNQMSKTIKNQMESIEAAKDELERKVIERTKELAETNKNLQNELIQREKIEKALLIAKQEAEAATIAKSEFLANMSHEIRTPLNAVIGLTGLALKTELTPKQRDYLKKIQSGSNTLLRLINDILDFSKIESGKLDIEQTGFYLSDVLNNISNLLSDSAAIKGIEFHIHKSRNVPNSLIGDPFRLEQVLINLTTNAIKFTEKGEVVLSVNLANNIESSLKEKSYQSKQAQKHVTINFSIKDTGIGITEEQRQRLFKPFMQADGSTTRKYGGSGLGLMISKSIVEAMGGEIGFHSEYGKGSTFFFNLKFDVQEDKAFYKKTLTLHHSFKGLRVLVVDDSATSREIMKDILESFGFVVDTANSGIEGIEKLKLSFLENPYSMVFLDWKMSGMDGINAAMKIRSESDLEKLSIIIMTTAYDMKNITDEAKRLNINGFITKPFEESMIFNTIMEVMGTEGFTLTKKEQVVENIALYKTHLLGSHVLLAEDSPLNQQVAEELLEMVGIKVDIAGDGEKAIKMAVDALNSKDQYRYDCILMDIQMPKMDGFEATRRIKGIDSLKDLPIIALTAHAIKGDREKCLSAGMNDYITKPINSEEFYKTLMKWIKPKKMMTSTSEDFIKVSGDEIIELPTKIEGIDIDKALKRMEENKKMYLNLLRIFLKEYENEINRIKQLHDDNDVSSLTRIVHSLKGDAGTIGAFNLQKQAETIEKTIKAGGYIADTIAETTSELQIVLNSIKNLLKTIDMGAQAHITQVPDKNIEDITHHINRLYKMLNEGNFAAKDLFEELKVHISNISQIKGDLTQLEEKIYSFDMDGAINVLCNIADKLQIRGIG